MLLYYGKCDTNFVQVRAEYGRKFPQRHQFHKTRFKRLTFSLVTFDSFGKNENVA